MIYGYLSCVPKRCAYFYNSGLPYSFSKMYLAPGPLPVTLYLLLHRKGISLNAALVFGHILSSSEFLYSEEDGLLKWLVSSSLLLRHLIWNSIPCLFSVMFGKEG